MKDTSKKFARFWKEVKRRKVLRSLAIYAGTAFIILEASSIIFPLWNFPAWSIKLVLWLLILGAFINVIIAWIYDITPGGIQRTRPLEEQSREEKAPDSRGWKAATYISLVVIVALVIFNVFSPSRSLKAGDIQSLLILPFDNFTGDDQLDYVAAGMHASLIGDMGQVSGLRVISKTTASIYKNMDMTLPEMASELNADAVVEPTVMCYGDSVCIQIRVITSFPEEKQLWIGEYKEEKSQIMSLYNRVCKQIADEVKVQLTSDEEQLLAKSRTINMDAYDAYLRGMYYWDQFTPESIPQALAYFNKAKEIEPEWALPYAGIAYYWILVRQSGMAPTSVTVPKIYEHLDKARRIDPNSSFTNYVSALARVWTEFNWELGEKEFLDLIKTNPSDAFSRVYYAHLLMTLQRDEEAQRQTNLALDLDPMNPMIQALASMVYAYTGEDDKAIEVAKKALALAPGNGAALTGLYVAYFSKREYNKGFNIMIDICGMDESFRQEILSMCDRKGYVEAAKIFAEEYEKADHVLPMEIALVYAIANNPYRAMDWLEKGYEDHDANVPYIGLNWLSKGPYSIGGPRLTELREKMNLPAPK